MNKSLLYTSSYINHRLTQYQLNNFFTKYDSILKCIQIKSDIHLHHIIFYASLKKSLRNIIKQFRHMDEATLYGAIHILTTHLYPFELLRKRESLVLVDNHCKASTLSTNKKKYHSTLNEVIQSIYYEILEEEIIKKYRYDFLKNPNKSLLIKNLYEKEQICYNTASKIAQKIPFYAKNINLSVEKDIEQHLFSLYTHHYVDPQDEIHILFSGKNDVFLIHNESWYNIHKYYESFQSLSQEI